MEIVEQLIELVREGGVTAAWLFGIHLLLEFLKPVAVAGIVGFTALKLVRLITDTCKAMKG